MSIVLLANNAADFESPQVGVTTSTGINTSYVSEGTSFFMSVADGQTVIGDFIFPKVDGVVWMHFDRCWVDYNVVPSATDGHIVYIRQTPGGSAVAGIDLLDGAIRVQAYGDTTVSGVSVATPDNARAIFDLSVEVTPSQIIANLYINGALMSSATAANTTGGKTRPEHAQFWMEDMTLGTYYISQIIIADDESTVGWRLAELKPNGAGAYSEWSGSHVDIGDTSLATVAGTTTNNARLSATISSYNGPVSPAGVRGVFVGSLAQRGSGGPTKLNHFLRIGGVDYYGVAKDVPAGSQRRQVLHEWAVNPATGLPWSTSDFAGIEMGLRAES